jgi:uncharacterized LabA/DUF88 family protein
MKTGIYVDAENVRLNGGFGMRYDVLMDYARLNGATILRANSYVVEDSNRLSQDPESADRLYKYFDILRNMGYKLIKKQARVFRNDAGEMQTKANVDIDLSIDALQESDKLDRVILVSGDGDYCRVVNALQTKGCRVEVIGFRNVSKDLREAADRYLSGYLVPGLLPIPGERTHRGFPDGDKVSSHGYGFFRTYKILGDRLGEETVFFHISKLINPAHQEKMESQGNIFEFSLEPSDRRAGDMQATNIILAAENVRV